MKNLSMVKLNKSKMYRTRLFNIQSKIAVSLIAIFIVSCAKDSASHSGGEISGEKSPEGQKNGSGINKGKPIEPPPPILYVSPKENKFKPKTGVMEMSCTMVDSMKLTWWWQNNGAREAMLLETPKSKNMFIIDSLGTTSYDMETLEGIRQEAKGGAFGYLSTLSGVISACETEAGKNPLVKKIEMRKILGKDCQGYFVNGASGLKEVKAWLYEGIPLMIEVNMGSKVTFEAKRLELDTKIDDSKFLVPKGVKLSKSK